MAEGFDQNPAKGEDYQSEEKKCEGTYGPSPPDVFNMDLMKSVLERAHDNPVQSLALLPTDVTEAVSDLLETVNAMQANPTRNITSPRASPRKAGRSAKAKDKYMSIVPMRDVRHALEFTGTSHPLVRRRRNSEPTPSSSHEPAHNAPVSLDDQAI